MAARIIRSLILLFGTLIVVKSFTHSQGQNQCDDEAYSGWLCDRSNYGGDFPAPLIQVPPQPSPSPPKTWGCAHLSLWCDIPDATAQAIVTVITTSASTCTMNSVMGRFFQPPVVTAPQNEEIPFVTTDGGKSYSIVLTLPPGGAFFFAVLPGTSLCPTDCAISWSVNITSGLPYPYDSYPDTFLRNGPLGTPQVLVNPNTYSFMMVFDTSWSGPNTNNGDSDVNRPVALNISWAGVTIPTGGPPPPPPPVQLAVRYNGIPGSSNVQPQQMVTFLVQSTNDNVILPNPKKGLYYFAFTTGHDADKLSVQVLSNPMSPYANGVVQVQLGNFSAVNLNNAPGTIGTPALSAGTPFVTKVELRTSMLASIKLYASASGARVNISIRTNAPPLFGGPPFSQADFHASFVNSANYSYKPQAIGYLYVVLSVDVGVATNVQLVMDSNYFCPLDCSSQSRQYGWNSNTHPYNPYGDRLPGLCNPSTGTCTCQMLQISSTDTFYDFVDMDELAGPGCAVDRCVGYTSCFQCAADPLCTWCASTATCVVGSPTSVAFSLQIGVCPDLRYQSFNTTHLGGINYLSDICNAPPSWVTFDNPLSFVALFRFDPADEILWRGSWTVSCGGKVYSYFQPRRTRSAEVATFLAYDPVTNTYSSKATLRSIATSPLLPTMKNCLNDTHIVISGGYAYDSVGENITFANATYAYSINDDKWSEVTLASCPSGNACFDQVYGASGAIADFSEGFLMIRAGGCSGENQGVTRVVAYCNGTGSMRCYTPGYQTAYVPLNVGRCKATMAYMPYNSVFVVYGGRNEDGDTEYSLEFLDPYSTYYWVLYRFDPHERGSIPGESLRMILLGGVINGLVVPETILLYPAGVDAGQNSFLSTASRLGTFDMYVYRASPSLLTPSGVGVGRTWTLTPLPANGPECFYGCFLGTVPSSGGAQDIIAVSAQSYGTYYTNLNYYVAHSIRYSSMNHFSLASNPSVRPPPLAGSSFISNGTHAYLWGGVSTPILTPDGGGFSRPPDAPNVNDLYILNLQTLEWTKVGGGQAPPTMRVYHLAALDQNGAFYVAGGLDCYGNQLNITTINKWDPQLGWTSPITVGLQNSQLKFPYYVGGAMGVTADGSITIMGGGPIRFNDSSSNSLLGFAPPHVKSPAGSSWTPLASFAGVEAALGTYVQCGSKLVILGGLKSDRTVLRDNHGMLYQIPYDSSSTQFVVYDLIAYKGTVIQAPVYRFLSSLACVNNVVYTIGGYQTSVNPRSDMIAWSPALGWSSPSPITDIDVPQWVTITGAKDKIVLFGGAKITPPSGFELQNTVYEYRDGYTVSATPTNILTWETDVVTVSIQPAVQSAANDLLDVLCLLDGKYYGVAGLVRNNFPSNTVVRCTLGATKGPGAHTLSFALGYSQKLTDAGTPLVKQYILASQVLNANGCLPGSVMNITTKSCMLCPAGTFAPNGTEDACLPCPAGLVSTHAGSTACGPCPNPIQVPDKGTCTYCDGQSWGVNGVCVPCTTSEVLSYSPPPLDGRQSRNCTYCGDNTVAFYVGDSDYYQCRCQTNFWGRPTGPAAQVPNPLQKPADPTLPPPPPGTYQYPTCTQCDLTRSTCFVEDANSDGTSLPIPLPGFWRFDNGGNHKILACASVTACPGGKNNTCGVGYQDTACAVCSPNYYSLNSLCNECPKDSTLRLFIAGLVIFLIVVILLKVAGNASGRGGGNFGSIGVAFQFVQLTAIFANLNLNWPKPLIDLFRVFSFLNFNIDIAAPECAIQLEYKTKWLFMMGLPILFLILFIIVYGLAWVRRGVTAIMPKRVQNCKASCKLCDCKPCYHQSPKEFERTRDTIGHSYLLFLSIGYLFMVSKSLEIYACTDVGGGERYLTAYPAQSCSGPTHDSMVPFSIIGIILYMIGIPVLYAYILRFKYHKMNIEFLPKFKARYGFLIARYTRKYFYWELLVMARKVLFVIFTVAFADTPVGQAIAGLMVLFLALLSQMFAWPFRVNNDNRLEATLLTTDYLILLSGLIFLTGKISQDATAAITAIVIVIVILSALVIVVYMASEFRNLYTTFKYRELTSKIEHDDFLNDMDEILHPRGYLEVLKWLNTAEPDDRERMARIASAVADQIRRGVHIDNDDSLVRHGAVPFVAAFKRTADGDDIEFVTSFLEMVEMRMGKVEAKNTKKKTGNTMLRRRATKRPTILDNTDSSDKKGEGQPSDGVEMDKLNSSTVENPTFGSGGDRKFSVSDAELFR